MAKKLYRSQNQKVLGGVAGGLAEYFDIDPVIVRILFLIALFGVGASILIYIILWIIIPMRPYFDPYQEVHNPESSYKEAETQNNEFQEQSEEVNIPGEDRKSDRNMKLFFGIVLIVIGFLSLADELFDQISIEYIFPGLLVALGVYLVTKPGYRDE